MENVFERGMKLLAECICSASADARLLSKTALQQAFAEAWLLPESTPLVSASGGAAGDSQDLTPAEIVAETPQEVVALSRRALFTTILGKTDPVAVTAVTVTDSTLTDASPAEPLPDFEPLLAATLAANPDMAVVTLAGEEAYHFLPLLSATYAGILAGKDDPARLMAATVRENSRDYPRPVPLDLFEYPPFDYSPELVQACLKALTDDPTCTDIRMTESSVGTVYLYSSLYLDHDYAEFLADREDVGLVLNP